MTSLTRELEDQIRHGETLPHDAVGLLLRELAREVDRMSASISAAAGTPTLDARGSCAVWLAALPAPVSPRLAKRQGGES